MDFFNIFFLILIISFPFINACFSSQKPGKLLNKGLSDKEPGSKEYDRELFLGRDTAEAMKELPIDDSLKKLALIAKKIDTNKDDYVDKDELIAWMNITHIKFIKSYSDNHFDEVDKHGEGKLTWSQFNIISYGFLDSKMYEIDDQQEMEITETRKRDELRFKHADLDQDGYVTKEEFRGFLYPEDYAHTRPNYALEVMKDIDKNGDNLVNFEEYLTDIMSEEDKANHPNWVEAEREKFKEIRDLDKDGSLNKDEVANWLFPIWNELTQEAVHLIYEADQNGDGVLEIAEILNSHDVFAGSKATEWGDALRSDL